MNTSKVALTMSAALLALWAVPAEAQRPRPRQQAGAQKSARKQTGSKQRGRARPDSPAAESAHAGTTPDAPVLASQPTSPQQPNTSLEPVGERPWANGVSKQQQDTAMALFQAGNTLLKESVFVQAAEKYRQALAAWDHPAIHYNLALALMNLDQPIEVHEHLVAALRYGPAPLENEKFEYARNYKTLMERQLARVDISCDTPGATVTMDGQTLFVAPGRYTGLVRPGAHSIVASKEGFLPTDQSRTLLPGETTTLELKMFTSEDLIEYRRKWPAWMPWLVAGAGMAVGGGSSWLHLQARDNIRALDAGVTECGGCFLTPSLDANRTRANTYQTLAIGGYAVGGAALITGVVLVYLNQPQPHRIDPTQKKVEVVGVTPLIGGGTGGLLTTFRF
ncbi:PEGA domain-containing protein [Archangium violaceum]|nr:PEGA domain-containing protein [Archangium violaceum]